MPTNILILRNSIANRGVFSPVAGFCSFAKMAVTPANGLSLSTHGNAELVGENKQGIAEHRLDEPVFC